MLLGTASLRLFGVGEPEGAAFWRAPDVKAEVTPPVPVAVADTEAATEAGRAGSSQAGRQALALVLRADPPAATSTATPTSGDAFAARANPLGCAAAALPDDIFLRSTAANTFGFAVSVETADGAALLDAVQSAADAAVGRSTLGVPSGESLVFAELVLRPNVAFPEADAQLQHLFRGHDVSRVQDCHGDDIVLVLETPATVSVPAGAAQLGWVQPAAADTAPPAAGGAATTTALSQVAAPSHRAHEISIVTGSRPFRLLARAYSRHRFTNQEEVVVVDALDPSKAIAQARAVRCSPGEPCNMEVQFLDSDSQLAQPAHRHVLIALLTARSLKAAHVQALGGRSGGVMWGSPAVGATAVEVLLGLGVTSLIALLLYVPVMLFELIYPQRAPRPALMFTKNRSTMHRRENTIVESDLDQD